MACKRSSVRPRYSPLVPFYIGTEIFDILTHKTVVLEQKSRYFTSERSISQKSRHSQTYVAIIHRQVLLWDCFPAVSWIVAEAKERSQGRMVDALAHGGDEGRDKLR